jgi:hypothetical protein
MADPFAGNDKDFDEATELSLHYQRSHALERGMDYQSNRGNPSTTVQAPAWWIKGVVVPHQNACFKKHFSNIAVFASSTWEEAGRRHIAKFADAPTYKSVRRVLMDATGDKDENCNSSWEMSELEETYDAWSPCNGKMLAVSYLAHITSWKTVWADIPMNYYDPGFWGALKQYTGFTKDQFYADFNEFIRIDNAEDEPPSGWAPSDADWMSADFLEVQYERF